MTTSSGGLFYRRPDPPLPDPASLPFPGNLIRLCQDCGLYKGCRAPVPGENISPHEIMLVGQNPGFQETNWGFIPFCGQAGVYLNSLLYQCGLTRDRVATTNVAHCMSPNNRPLTQVEIKACSHWLELELAIVNPRIVVALGAPAVAHFLGTNAGTMEHLHGKPVEKDGRIILPAYHPAAALRDTAKLRQCLDDFMVLRGLVRGESWQSFHVKDEYPNPDYRVADTPAKLKQMKDEIEDAGLFAVDTETCRGKLWSVQISARPGTAWFIPIKPEHSEQKVDLTVYNATAIVHFYLHDIKYLIIDDDKFFDTMTLAYQLGLPQGLKELASRICGITMVNYKEVVKTPQQKLSLEYLEKASVGEWPNPPELSETKWDNRKGCIVTRIKKPWHISRKVSKILADYKSNPDTDLWDRWNNIPDLERLVVEDVLGEMAESSLMDIPLEQAVQYSCRDSDSTLRVFSKLKQMIEQADMDFVLDTDLRVLPMVDSMMRNGMAVDVEHCRRLSADYTIRMRTKAAELAGMVGHPFNPASSKQVAAVVYGELGFKPTKLTPTKEISTDDAELKKTGHPVAKGIIQYRGLQKLKTTYADNVVKSAHPDENGVPRMHTVLKTTRVETGRLSSSKDENGEGANLQNIPTRSKEAKNIKNAFIAPDGKIMAELDLSQIEMRVQAHLAKCKNLINLFVSGKDSHTTTASKLFGVSYEEATQKKYRYPAKCFHPDTEVLTPNGWKKIIDLIPGKDKVVQAIPGDYGSVSLEWVLPTEVFTTIHPSGKLVHLKNYGINLRVTPDHRMLAWQTKKHRVVTPYELGKQRCWTNAGIIEGNVEVDSRLLRLAVATEADGSFSWRKISFGFYNKRKIARLRKLAQYDVAEADYSNGKNRPFHSMRLNRDLSDKVRSLLDKDKSFPWWWLNLTPKLRELVLDELQYWDGGSYDNSAGYRYTSGNSKSKDVVQALCAITNRKCSQDRKTSKSKGKEYPICNIQIKDHATTRGGNLKVVEEDYSGEVACLSVPSSFVLVRSGGIPVITGQTMNFGIIYLIGPQGLSSQINEYIADLEMEGEPVEVEPWDVPTCERFINEYYKLYPEIRDYQAEMVAHARRHGYVVDMIGRRRYIPEVFCPIRSIQEAGARQAANFPVTSSAQAIIKMAMGKLWKDTPKTEWAEHVRWEMQIHDSIVLEVTDQEDIYIPFLKWVKSVMCGVVSLLVPVDADAKIGKRWGELAKIKLED